MMNSAPTNHNADLSPDATARGRMLVVVGENLKRKFIADGISGRSSDNLISNGKDLSHTIRGETVLERPRDLSQLRRRLLAPTASPRPKKSAHRRERTKGPTILSILTKVMLLLAALLYLGQAIWKWTAGAGKHANYPFAALDYDGRISEVEESLKKTAKMLQVQVDIVDRKIGSEISSLTRELTKQLEEGGALLEEELKKLELRTDEVGKFYTDLKGMNLLTKEELEKFLNELKSKRNLDELYNSVGLDEIRAVARDIIEKEIEKHAADGLGRVDYALVSGGARVVRHSEPYVFGRSNSWLSVAKGKSGVHSSAQKMLEPSFGEPGQCFPLHGSSGFVEVRLRAGIVPEAVTLEHVAKSVAYDRSSAPKDCQISGWFEGPEDDPTTKAGKIFVLTDFTYDLERSNVQTFSIPKSDAGIINMIRLDFFSNHGSSTLTCIYRLRVHGYELSSVEAMDTQP
ncbi:hypothetical protein HPP92_020791 [Vanilla planifolia]|uniref:SUN domain-containing protein n=1 Tax=Vanilla planifolia TaxID=51239 RepID=A0A835Q149_VANPL|nr:hypothetical protein HPP92_020791 [Vanilla planifolia]